MPTPVLSHLTPLGITISASPSQLSLRTCGHLGHTPHGTLSSAILLCPLHCYCCCQLHCHRERVRGCTLVGAWGASFSSLSAIASPLLLHPHHTSTPCLMAASHGAPKNLSIKLFFYLYFPLSSQTGQVNSSYDCAAISSLRMLTATCTHCLLQDATTTAGNGCNDNATAVTTKLQ